MKKLIVIILVTVLLFSCSNNEPDDLGMKEKVTNVYKTIPMELPDNVTAGNSFVVQDDAVYVLCTQETEDIVYKIGFDGKVLDSTPLVNDEESTFINSYYRFNDGRYLLMYQNYIDKISYFVRIYSESDELLSEIDVSSKVTPDITDVYLNYMITDGDNNIYLSGYNYLIVLTENGDKIYDNTFGGNSYINYLGKTDNKIFVSYTNYTGNSSTSIAIIDVASKSLNTITIPEEYNTYSYKVYMGPEYDFYFKDSVGLYGYKTETDESTLLVNWANSDLNERYVNNITIISPDCFIFTGYNQINQRNQLNMMNRIPDDEVKAKYIIRVNSFGDHMGLLTTAAVQFNLENDEYRVIVEQLTQETNTDYAEWRGSVLNNYINGDIPDIIQIENDMAYQNLMDQGAFVNLYELLDNDPDINRDSLFNCVKLPFERNGNLYQLFTFFNIQTLTAKTENVKDIAKWDISGAIDFIENLPDGVSFTQNDSMDMMSNIFLSKGFDSFIDYENATCNFDNEDFRKILNLLSNYGVADYTLYNQMRESGEIDKNYKDNKIIFSAENLYFFSSYLQLRVKFNLEDITFMGFPSSEGNSSIIMGTSYAISSKSQHKEGAWEFLKYLLREDVQNAADPYLRPGFPSTLDSFYQKAEREMSTVYSFHSGSGYSSRYRMEDEMVPLNESADNMGITQEDVDFLVKFFNSEVSVFRYDMSLVNIIYEELMPFMEGTKSLEETVKIIQSRGLVYMNENYS